MSIDARSAALATSASAIVTMTLERVGWEIRSAEIDLVRGEVILSVHRFDGRWLYVRGADDGVCVERFRRSEVTERRAAGLLVDVVRDEFLSRDRFDGLHAALRHVCNYIADNPSPGFPALPSVEIRGALQLLLRP